MAGLVSSGFNGFFAVAGHTVDVGDTAALRAAFNVVHRNGYLSDGTGDDVQQSGRLRFKWVPSDSVSLLLSTDFSHIGGDNGGYTYLPLRPGADPWEGVASPAAIDLDASATIWMALEP